MANHCHHSRLLSHSTKSFFTCTSSRAFSTSRPIFARQHKTNALSLIPASAPQPPPYPFPRRTWYKQADHGLYGGTSIQFGNNVSEKNEIKTRRVWRPNTQFKHLYSDALKRTLRLRVSTRVLRTIDKAGGLDRYLLGASAQRVKELGEEGWKLRWAVLQTPAIQARMIQSPTLRQMVQGTGVGALSDIESANDVGEESGFQVMGDEEEEAVIGAQIAEELTSEAQANQIR